jgi:site-specific recombinase XerD
MMYRQGLRVSEAIQLRLDALNLKQSSLWVKRLKNSLSTQQPIASAKATKAAPDARVDLTGWRELRAIKRYLATRTDRLPWLFVSERGHAMTRQAVISSKPPGTGAKRAPAASGAARQPN